MTYLTVTDLFCGAGGSSTGAAQIPGIVIAAAANHWNLAVETHNSNHPDALHLCADLSQVDPRLFPTSDIGWFSPSCTKHSVAQGKKRQDKIGDHNGEVLPDAAAERSRATMWDVVRFAEYHDYRAVIVENVVDVYYWPPFHAWLSAMSALGYHHRLVWLNSMHAQLFGRGAPQSRDRLYVVFWKEGATAPDLDLLDRPLARCVECGPVRPMKVWKKPNFQWGRYRAQYTFQCPTAQCRRPLEPAVRPAADVIDWSLQGTRIADRQKPLADKTMARIQAGIDRYWSPMIVEAAGNTYDAADPKHPRHGQPGAYMRAWPTDQPLRTVHTTMSKSLVIPVEGRDGKQAQPGDVPLRTMTTRNETALVQAHSFIAELRGGGSKHRPTASPLCTVTASGNHHGLVTPAGGTWREQATPANHPIPTRTTRETDGIAFGPTIDINDVYFRMLEPREIIAAMDFPDQYVVLGNRREQVRMAGNAVTPPAARDLVGIVAGSIDPAFMPDFIAA